MIYEDIEYTDYNGTPRKERFYFNLNEAELTEMNFSEIGGAQEYIQRIMAANDQKELVRLFKDFVLKSYGQKSADGRRFMKSQELRDAFEQNPAYPKIFMMLASDADEAARFINGVVPKNISDEAKKIQAEEVEKLKNAVIDSNDKVVSLPVQPVE